MKKIIYLFIFITLALGAGATEPQEALRAFLASNAVDPDRTALLVWDLEADYQVAAHRAKEPITPASVMKCVTTAALSTVAPYDTRLNTRVTLQGVKDGDSFTGNLVVKGSGDPSLGDGRHNDRPDFIRQITDRLTGKGINNFYGNVIIDDALFAGPSAPPSWPQGDRDQGYGTGVHAFNFEANASGKKSVGNPGDVFKRKLTAAMAEAGITYTETATPSGSDAASYGKEIPLIEYSSPRLGELMRSCMFRSDNLYAEAFMRLFGLNNGGTGAYDMSAQIAMQHWEALNFPTEGVMIVDGSGLSRDNRLTAQFLGDILRWKNSDPEYTDFFPLCGEEGTVKGFLADTPLKGRMALKTGSMSGIQAYAGYLIDSDYAPTHVVVVITDGLKNRGEFRNALTRFFLDVFQDAPN